MDKIQELVSLCKCGIFILINEHRDNGLTVREFFEMRKSYDETLDVKESEVVIMEEKDTIYSVQAYPDTTIGSYHCYHYDLNLAVYEIIESIKQDRSCKN